MGRKHVFENINTSFFLSAISPFGSPAIASNHIVAARTRTHARARAASLTKVELTDAIQGVRSGFETQKCGFDHRETDLIQSEQIDIYQIKKTNYLKNK